MAAHRFEDLIEHVGHQIVCVTYGKHGAWEYQVINVAIECETCNMVLMDFDNDALLRSNTRP